MLARQAIRVASRSYATASASVQVPVALYGIEGRYATALYTAAAKKKNLDTVEADLNRLRAILDKDAKLKSFLETPIANNTTKREGIKQLVSQSKFSETVANLLDLLAENGRLDHTSKIIDGYEQLMTAHRGQVTITITSAKELDARVTNTIKGHLQKSSILKAGQNANIVNKVNPQILGGLIIEFGDNTIDLSISSKITKLNRLLTETI
ncbi:OSCP/delta subunit of ATPase [Polychytrium aggregatum]|uniref:OSCP/delta subunit of ATPase n=1 Tax=Polychytrium aggregatum TaxID=110093 RepID=UPI0022FDF0EB|nr:OSCP/delta subunit of ATPase [Polychytrium aggregatum]KAI9205043.1 OSCP/delta subunit of ATPase [Polychytrium aggregatum]